MVDRGSDVVDSPPASIDFLTSLLACDPTLNHRRSGARDGSTGRCPSVHDCSMKQSLLVSVAFACCSIGLSPALLYAGEPSLDFQISELVEDREGKIDSDTVIAPGDTLQITYSAFNSGNNVGQVGLRYDIPTGFTLEFMPEGAESCETNSICFSLVTVRESDTVSFPMIAVTASAASEGVHRAELVPFDYTDPALGNDESRFYTPVVAGLDLGLVAAVTGSQVVELGDTVTFELTIQRDKSNAVANKEFSLKYLVPGGWSLVSPEGSKCDDDTLCYPVNIAAGETQTISIVMKSEQAGSSQHRFSLDLVDDNPDNNTEIIALLVESPANPSEPPATAPSTGAEEQSPTQPGSTPASEEPAATDAEPLPSTEGSTTTTPRTPGKVIAVSGVGKKAGCSQTAVADGVLSLAVAVLAWWLRRAK